ncbi:autophagy-related protein [Geopyxis carbonaria]|nr:autophagy-related protein [Geopyxis carbonaria]
MERPPVFSLEVIADRSLLSDVLKGVLCTIFFHRFFSSFRPKTKDLLDLTLPSFDDEELEQMINERTHTLMSTIEANSGAMASKGQIAVQFYEKKPRKASWFAKAEEKVCWEQWILNITLLEPRTDSEKIGARRTIEEQLQATVLTIITIAGKRKDHVPPITTTEHNPFPYTIMIPPKGDTWGARMGIF